jgi:hypothetical protein
MTRRCVPRLAALAILAAVACSSVSKPKPAPATSASTTSSAPAILRTTGFVQQSIDADKVEFRVAFPVLGGHLADHRLSPTDTIVTDGVILVLPGTAGPILEIMSRGDYHARYPEAANAALGACMMTSKGGAFRCQLPTCPNPPDFGCTFVQEGPIRYCTCTPP